MHFQTRVYGGLQRSKFAIIEGHGCLITVDVERSSDERYRSLLFQGESAEYVTREKEF